MRRFLWHPFMLYLLISIAPACSAEIAAHKLPPNTVGEVHVTVHVLDEYGVPIPYATVWQRFSRDVTTGRVPPDQYDRPAIDQTGIVRIANRHRNEFEDFHNFRFPLYWIGNGINHPPLTGSNGSTVDRFLPEEWQFPRSALTELGYVAMKRGYVLADGVVDTRDGRSEYVLTLRLRRDTGAKTPSSAYQETFDRLRYELSFTDRNEQGQARLVAIHRALGAALADAEAAGDKSTAARIANRMSYLPKLLFDERKGEIGFAQTVPDDPANLALRAKAAMLDPEAMLSKAYQFDRVRESMFKRYAAGQWPQSAEERVLSVPYIEAMERIVRSMGDDAEPWHRVQVADNFARLRQYQRAYEELKAIREWEPYAVLFEKEVKDLKIVMRLDDSKTNLHE